MNSYEQDARVLVVVMTNLGDFDIAQRQGWYRIPLKRAPRRVAADYLAFYQTSVFGDEAWAVRYYAPVQRFRIVHRYQLLPEESQHPRAKDRYYKVEIGPLLRLSQAIPSRRLRRVTFIPTTLSKLLTAREINDLWWRDRPEERLWTALREAGLMVEYRFQLGDQVLDFALFCQDGRIAILCEEDGQPCADLKEVAAEAYELESHAEPEILAQPTSIHWHWLAFSRHQLERELPACVGAVLALVNRLGGQLNPG
ncbi:MAG: hypothetical protein U9R25_14450 [Chloroflexota bacterium]|nr:hypothetical protein [Chloroflexota bacterium]